MRISTIERGKRKEDLGKGRAFLVRHLPLLFQVALVANDEHRDIRAHLSDRLHRTLIIMEDKRVVEKGDLKAILVQRFE